jgi:hypothetical protein
MRSTRELDIAQAIRALMLKSLWQQDDEEEAARKVDAEAIKTLANRIQSRLGHRNNRIEKY